MPDFQCDFCHKYLKTSQGLKSHITRLHKDTVIAPSTLLTPPTDTLPQDVSLPPIFDGLLVAKELANNKKHCNLVRRIPKGARSTAADVLTDLINNILNDNTSESWTSLLRFPSACLLLPKEDSSPGSLATKIKKNIAAFRLNDFLRQQSIKEDTEHHDPPPPGNVAPSRNSFSAKLVESKLAEGDVTGAVRNLCSEEVFAPNTKETLDALILKHPAQDNTTSPLIEPIQNNLPSTIVTVDMVKKAIDSFPTGSASGPDGSRPQHLKDLISLSAEAGGLRLVAALCKLCTLMLKGEVFAEVCPALYGATLHAFKKKDGGIRPIAVGNTIRRLAAKIGSNEVRVRLGEIFQPTQLGFGTRGGSEAAAHAARRFISFPHREEKAFLKIDFKNAFNSLSRPHMLQAVRDFMPELYPFLSQCYSQPTHLMFKDIHISSQSGIQQGDPLGPAVFCSVTHPLATSMISELNIWYLDDAALGGHPNTVLRDFNYLIRESSKLGLVLNFKKCEIFTISSGASVTNSTIDLFNEVAPEIRQPELNECVLLGAPLSDEAIPQILEKKTNALKLIKSRLTQIKAHPAFMILKNALAIPKLTYTLRCAPTWKAAERLQGFDQVLKSTLESICNNNLSEDAWIQAGLPISDGGLGIRHASSLAIPAFLSSVSSSAALTSKLLPLSVSDSADVCYLEATTAWSNLSNKLVSTITDKRSQKSWESIILDQVKTDLLERAPTLQDKARLLGVSSKESGAFLNALPSPALGTLLDDNAFRIAISLRLGTKMCQPYPCSCGSQVDCNGLHGLSCKKSPGRSSRHSMVNDIIGRGLVSAGFPVALEPTFLSNQDNRRPDGTTLIPWADGKYLTWDFTCVNSQASSYLSTSAGSPLRAASAAEEKKKTKYSYLDAAHLFKPIAAECLGSFGPESLQVLKKIGRKIEENTGEKRALEFFLQRLSVAIQRGNATSILATIPRGASLEDFLGYL